MNKLLIRPQQSVEGIFLKVPAALQCGIDKIFASLYNDLGPPVVLNLYAAPEIQVPYKRPRRNDDFCQRLGRYLSVELGCIERRPELSVKAKSIEVFADSGYLDQLFGAKMA